MEGRACENRAQSPDKTAIVCKKEEVEKKGMFPPFFTLDLRHRELRSVIFYRYPE